MYSAEYGTQDFVCARQVLNQLSYVPSPWKDLVRFKQVCQGSVDAVVWMAFNQSNTTHKRGRQAERKMQCYFHSDQIARIESESWKELSNDHLVQSLSPCGCDLFLEFQSRESALWDLYIPVVSVFFHRDTWCYAQNNTSWFSMKDKNVLVSSVNLI